MRLSVYIPVWNRGNLVGEAIESCLAQTRLPDEILIIDDGSTDDTLQVVRKYQSTLIRVVERKRQGIPRTRNYAVENTKGDVILSLDSDDIMMPDCLELHERNFAKRPNLLVSYGDQIVVDHMGESIGCLEFDDWFDRDPLIKGQLILRNLFPNSCTAIKRAVFEQFGGYDSDYTRAQDYELWARIAGSCSFGHAGGVLCHYRMHKGNTSTPFVKYDRSYERRIQSELINVQSIGELFPVFDFTRVERAAADGGLYVWGAGEYGAVVIELLSLNGMNVHTVVDSDSKKEGSVFEGIPVVNPSSRFYSELKSSSGYVLVCSMHYSDIMDGMRSKGLVEGVDFGSLDIQERQRMVLR